MGLNMRELLPELEKIIVPIVENNGYELVEISVAGVGSSSTLRIFIHRPGGVTVGEIEKISKKISKTLDDAGIMEHRYFLEVSSPGLDRPLKTLRDFERNISEEVELFLNDNKKVEGTIMHTNLNEIILENEQGQQKIPFSNISYGKIKIRIRG